MTTSTPRATAHPSVEQATPTTPKINRRWSYLVIAAVVAGVPGWMLTRPDSRIATELEFTGSPQSYVIPAGICRIRIDAVGAAGGPRGTAGAPGGGAEAIAAIAVTPRETLRIRVGGWGGEAVGTVPGAGGWNGGGTGGRASERPNGLPGAAGSGGGGATDIRRGGDALEHRIVIAGGGSGGAGDGIGGQIGTGGGDAGAPNGTDGLALLGSANPATGGAGATQAAGGPPGRNAPDLLDDATAGTLGVGGNGASGGASGGGGGGGGLYGGGGGGSSRSFSGGHGGGGSGFGPPGTDFRTGVGGGFGQAKITYDPSSDACNGN